MTKVFLPIVLIFWLANGNCQNIQHEIDSLERALQLPAPDSIRVLQQNKLGVLYSRTDIAKAKEYIERSIAMTDRFSASRWQDSTSFFRHRAITHLTLGNWYHRRHLSTMALPLHHEALLLSKKVRDTLTMGKALMGIGGHILI